MIKKMPQIEIYIDARNVQLENRENSMTLIIPTQIILKKGSGYLLSIKNKEELQGLQLKYNELLMSLLKNDQIMREEGQQLQVPQNSQNTNNAAEGGTIQQNNNETKQQQPEQQNTLAPQINFSNNYNPHQPQPEPEPQPQRSYNPYAKKSAYQNYGVYNNSDQRSSQQQYPSNQQQNYSQNMNIFGNNPIRGGNSGRHEDCSSSRNPQPVQNIFMCSVPLNANKNNNSLFGASDGPSKKRTNSKYSSI